MIRSLRVFLREEPHTNVNWNQSTAIVQILIKVFYFSLFFMILWNLPCWTGFYNTVGIDPLWPIAWFRAFKPVQAVTGILIFYLVSGFLGVVGNGQRWIRISVFLGLLEFMAFRNSFGKIGHSNHLVLLIAFFLIFLPTNWNQKTITRKTRQNIFLIFWACQAIILLTYSMSGIGKISCGLYQLFTGQISVFHPHALAIHVAERLLETNSTSLVGEWLIERPWAGWPMMLSSVYLQFFSIIIFFRPSTQKVWAIGLMLLHVGIFFTMTINFPINSFLLMIFFLASPFAGEITDVRKFLINLPLIKFATTSRPFFNYKKSLQFREA
jgi:hypothetical protein